MMKTADGFPLKDVITANIKYDSRCIYKKVIKMEQYFIYHFANKTIIARNIEEARQAYFKLIGV